MKVKAKSMKNIFTFLLFFSVVAVVTAQQAPQYSLYMWNKFAFNPAYAGMDNSLSVTGVFRDQWVDLPGRPKNQAINAHMPLYIANGGVGIGFESETIGSWKNISAMAAYNYQMVLGNSGVLSLGLSAGFIQRELDGSLVRTPEGIYNPETGELVHNDPSLPFDASTVSGAAPTAHAGVFYQGEKFEFGLSAMNLLENEISFSTFSFKPDRSLYLYAGYRLDIGKKFTIDPSVLVKSNVDQTQMDFSVMITYNENIFGGASFRGYNSNSNDAVAILTGFKLSEKIAIGYSYDLTLSTLNQVTNGTHEILLNYNLGKPIGKGKPPIIIYNPRSL